jgi:glycosyltransferase involved in cell wall biosynthesis
MRIFDRPEQYIQEMIITERLTDEKILDLHYTCDCFVNPSHGEAFSYPTLDALGMGKPVIASNNGGMCDIVPDNCGILVGGNYGAVQGVHDTFGGLYVGLEKWFNIDEDELSQSMRQVFDNRESSYYRTMSDNARKVPQKFSYENIGNKVKKLLEVK